MRYLVKSKVESKVESCPHSLFFPFPLPLGPPLLGLAFPLTSPLSACMCRVPTQRLCLFPKKKKKVWFVFSIGCVRFHSCILFKKSCFFIISESSDESCRLINNGRNHILCGHDYSFFKIIKCFFSKKFSILFIIIFHFWTEIDMKLKTLKKKKIMFVLCSRFIWYRSHLMSPAD
jgi:hypothetical protein